MMTEKTDILTYVIANAEFKCILQQMSSLKLNCASESYALTNLKSSKTCFMLKL